MRFPFASLLFLLLIAPQSLWAQDEVESAPNGNNQSTPAADEAPSGETDQSSEIKQQREMIESLQSRLEEMEGRFEESEMAQLTEESMDTSGPSLDIYGFFDFGFYKFFIEDDNLLNGIINENPYFTVQHLNLYLFSQLSDSFSMTAEVRFSFLPRGQEDGFEFPGISEYDRVDTKAVDAATSEHLWLGGLVIERAHLTWEPSDHFGIIAGRFLTPYGIWNVDHGSPVIITVRAPFTIIHRYVPLAQTGLQAYGRFFPSDQLFIDYAFTVSNGRGPVESIEDMDANKALGLRLCISYEGDDVTLAIGGHGYWGDYSDTKKRIMSTSPFVVKEIPTADYSELVGSFATPSLPTSTIPAALTKRE